MYVANSQFNDGNVTYKPGDIIKETDVEKLNEWLKIGYIVNAPEAAAQASGVSSQKNKNKGAAR